ncbi:unnamed protein product [Dibothriocephalus latus]|uniref:Uncharacterized protein n=1 Tax=Dibothriocephalus latus TaxID=60516 RepID=A0A3P7NKJ5_DIBLA|nr:unnamed protein product [Dibothriocephalus latus]
MSPMAYVLFTYLVHLRGQEQFKLFDVIRAACFRGDVKTPERLIYRQYLLIPISPEPHEPEGSARVCMLETRG